MSLASTNAAFLAGACRVAPGRKKSRVKTDDSLVAGRHRSASREKTVTAVARPSRARDDSSSEEMNRREAVGGAALALGALVAGPAVRRATDPGDECWFERNEKEVA